MELIMAEVLEERTLYDVHRTVYVVHVIFVLNYKLSLIKRLILG